MSELCKFDRMLLRDDSGDGNPCVYIFAYFQPIITGDNIHLAKLQVMLLFS